MVAVNTAVAWYSVSMMSNATTVVNAVCVSECIRW